MAPQRFASRRHGKFFSDATPNGSELHADAISVTKIKKDLIHKAKVKKAYQKIKAREEQVPAPTQDAPGHGDDAGHDEAKEAAEQIHPARQLMLKDEDRAQAGALDDEAVPSADGQRRRTRRPGYYDKQLQQAEEQRAETERRQLEIQRRRQEREVKLAERDKFKRAMAKTRGRDGKKKLGRESGMLLDKVRRLVADK